MLIVKKPDAPSLPPYPKHRFVLEDMIQRSVWFKEVWDFL